MGLIFSITSSKRNTSIIMKLLATYVINKVIAPNFFKTLTLAYPIRDVSDS